MFRKLTTTSTQDLAKWGVYALVLLAPGSFIVLPLLWLARRWSVRLGWR